LFCPNEAPGLGFQIFNFLIFSAISSIPFLFISSILSLFLSFDSLFSSYYVSHQTYHLLIFFSFYLIFFLLLLIEIEDVWGEEFEELYTQYEEEGRARFKIVFFPVFWKEREISYFILPKSILKIIYLFHIKKQILCYFRETIPAQKLWFSILESQIETGTPYMLYKVRLMMDDEERRLCCLE